MMTLVPSRAFTGTPLLKSYWQLVPIVAKYANCMQILTSSNGSIKCGARNNYVRIYFTCWNHYGYSLQDLRRTNRTAGSTLSPVTCLVSAHAEAALDEFRLWTLRGPAVPHAPGPPRYGSRPNRGEAHCRQHVACGPPSPRAGASSCRSTKINSRPFPGLLPEDCFRPPANIIDCVSFGQEEGDDSMSISASERED